MSHRQKHSQSNGISLPKSLLEQIDSSNGSNSRHHNIRGGPQLSRKDARKQARLDHKKRKADHLSASAPPPQANHAIPKRKQQDEPVETPKKKRRRTGRPSKDLTSGTYGTQPSSKAETSRAPAASSPKAKPKKSANGDTALARLAAKTERKLKTASRSTVPRTRQEQNEDAYIAYLESKLGYLRGGKKKGEDDGLDDLLDFTNTVGVPLEEQSDEEVLRSDDESNEEEEEEEDGEFTSDEDVEEGSEWDGLDEEDAGHSSETPVSSDANKEEDEVPPAAPVSAPAGKYIPPSLRNKSGGAGADEQQIKLTRQFKGLINRMSEQNMASILDSIEDAYRKHRRHDITSTLTTLIIEGISSHSSLLDSFVVLHAALVSSLHKLVGVEFAAYLLQNVISTYERHLKAADQSTSEPGQEQFEDAGKEASNLIVLLSELYNFQVISCILMYDIIRDLLSTALSELRVELLLKVLRNSGAQLRQDDPSALRDIISLAQENLDKQSVSSSRTRFMMETLLNLKNNKINKKAAAQHQGGDAVERLKKFLSGLGRKKHLLAHEPLRVSLGDLHSAETKGKWWLVGAAWGGDPLVEQNELARRGGAPQKDKSEQPDPTGTALVKLAKKQGMNTDIRRSIFVVMMSSDDYLDACERLAQLNLTEVQQREIIRVALRCCGNEKSYNPFYALVCQQLCQTSHSYKVTLQFCLWDFLRDLGETNVGGAEVIKNLADDGGAFDGENVSSTRICNVAKAYAWWITRDCCTLMILKPIDFTQLKPQSRKFLRELFVQLFVASQVSSPMLLAPGAELPSTRNRNAVEEIFMKASRIENLALGLTYLLVETFRKEDGLLKWGCTVARETLQTGIDHVPRL